MTDKQPDALWWADVLMRDVGSQLANRKQAAALLRTQHAEIVKCHTEIGAQARKNAEQRAAIERKDALLRQALEALHGVLDKYGEPVNVMSISGGPYEVVQCRDAITEINKEIGQ